MERVMQAILIAGIRHRDEVQGGEKCITIRLGHRDYTLGAVMIGCPVLDWCVIGNIVSVKHTTLDEVTQEEMEADGFLSKSKMLCYLRYFYPDIDLGSQVTVVRWEYP